MDYGIVLISDRRSNKRAPELKRMSDAIKAYLAPFDFGGGVKHMTTCFNCAGSDDPGMPGFFKPVKPSYKKIVRFQGATGPVVLHNVFSHEVQLTANEYRQFVSASEDELVSVVATALVRSLSDLEKLPKRVKNFDRERFSACLREYVLSPDGLMKDYVS